MVKGQTDWRLQTITNLAEDWTSPWTGQTAKKGTQITVVTIARSKLGKAVTLPLPNATALMINASQRSFRNASILWRKSKVDESKSSEVDFKNYPDAFEYLECMMESVLTAYAGLEAFLNDVIPEDFEYISNRKSDTIVEVSDKFKIQRHISIAEKITQVLPEVLGIKSPKGNSKSWEEFKKLERLRNRITHMKTEDRKSAQLDEDTVWHSLVTASPPYSQALSVIMYFSEKLEPKPRWIEKCPIN